MTKVLSHRLGIGSYVFALTVLCAIFIAGPAALAAILPSGGRALCTPVPFSLNAPVAPGLNWPFLIAPVAPGLNVPVAEFSAPVALGLRPQSPPLLTLGKNVFTDDGQGNVTLTEPLVDIRFSGMEIPIRPTPRSSSRGRSAGR